MPKILDALLGRAPKSTPGQIYNGMFTGTSIATEGQPVPVAMAIQPPSDLTAGSDLNRTAWNAWPTPIESGKLNTKGGWVPSWRRAPWHQTLLGNYSGADSEPNWQFVGRAYGGIGNYPWSGSPSPFLPEYNELNPIHWGDRVDNENIDTGYYTAPTDAMLQNRPSVFIPTATASLKNTGETLL